MLAHWFAILCIPGRLDPHKYFWSLAILSDLWLLLDKLLFSSQFSGIFLILRTPGLNTVLEVYLCPQVPEKKGIKMFSCHPIYWVFHFICCLWVHALPWPWCSGRDRYPSEAAGVRNDLLCFSCCTFHLCSSCIFWAEETSPLALSQPFSMSFCVSNQRKQDGFDHVSVMGQEDEPALQVCKQALHLCAGTAAVALDLNVCRIWVTAIQHSHFQRCWTSL